jgi:hypothetical protein
VSKNGFLQSSYASNIIDINFVDKRNLQVIQYLWLPEEALDRKLESCRGFSPWLTTVLTFKIGLMEARRETGEMAPKKASKKESLAVAAT